MVWFFCDAVSGCRGWSKVLRWAGGANKGVRYQGGRVPQLRRVRSASFSPESKPFYPSGQAVQKRKEALPECFQKRLVALVACVRLELEVSPHGADEPVVVEGLGEVFDCSRMDCVGDPVCIVRRHHDDAGVGRDAAQFTDHPASMLGTEQLGDDEVWTLTLCGRDRAQYTPSFMETN